MRSAPIDFSRILVCQLSLLGDVLLATPAIECLARAYPGAEIHVLTDTRAAPLLENNPHITRIHAVNAADTTGIVRALRIALRMTRSMRFDLVVDYQRTVLTRIVAMLSGAQVRIADTSGLHLRPFYTHMVTRRPGYAARSKVDLLAPLGFEWQGERPRIYLDEGDRAEALTELDALFSGEASRGGEVPVAEQNAEAGGAVVGQDEEHGSAAGSRRGAWRGRLVSVDPTQARPCRRWPEERFARLLAMVWRAHPELVFLLLHGPGEEEIVQAVHSAAVEQGVPAASIRYAAQPLPLRTAAACIEAAVLHVGNCSLPRHLAVATSTPSLTVMGPTDEASWTYPWSVWGGEPHEAAMSPLSCAPCAVAGSKGDCGEPLCMEALEVDAAYSALERVLSAAEGGAT